MADASYVQTSFGGGEWSKSSQGQLANPKYRSAMNLSYNGFPVSEGSWVSRPGTKHIVTTRRGLSGRVLPYNFTDSGPYEIELTDQKLRLIAGDGLVHTDDKVLVSSISADTPALVTTAAQTWSTDDAIEFEFTSTTDAANGAPLRRRRFRITTLTTTTFTIADETTNAAIDGSTLAFDAAGAVVKAARVLELATPFTDALWPDVRLVKAANAGPQGENNAVLLQGNAKPRALSVSKTPATTPDVQAFTIAAQDFSDGPYLDPVPGAILTPNAKTGTITLTLSYQPWLTTVSYPSGTYASYGGTDYISLSDANLNQTPGVSPLYWRAVSPGSAVGPNGFVSTDVGRCIRLFSEPKVWSPDIFWNFPVYCKYLGTYYYDEDNTIPPSTTFFPPQNPAYWEPVPVSRAAVYVWGRITEVTSPTVIKVQVVSETGADKPESTALLYVEAISEWRLGVYSDTTGWPKVGAYFEGRLALSGVVGNRVDFSKSNDIYDFAPTNRFGEVAASNAVSSTFNNDKTNEVRWLKPTTSGLIAGTQSGEWLIDAPTPGAFAPTNQRARQATKVGCAKVEPADCPLAMIFVQRFGSQLFEYFPEVFSTKLTAPNLNVFAQHLSSSGILELAYQTDPSPLLWARRGDGALIGATYRRNSAYANQEPDFVGFHQHHLGGSRVVESLCVNSTPDETRDVFYVVSTDSAAQVRHVERSTILLDENAVLTDMWFLDDAVVPSGAKASATGITFYGLWHLNGKTVAAWVGGLDCGDVVVSNGQCTVPYTSTFTLAYLQSLNGSYDLSVALDSPAITFPAVIGLPYDVKGQVLRPVASADVGTQNGPAFGKTRREHMFGVLMVAGVSGGVSFGTDFSKLRPALFADKRGVSLPKTTLYGGLHWNTIEDDYTFDSMLCWLASRPYPVSIAAIGGFVHGQDR